MFWGAVRLVGGTAAMVGGGWALRALQGAPAALGASPVEIDAVAKRSPNYHDGVFSNLEPASATSLTRQQQFMLAREVIGGSSNQHPSQPVPLVTPAAGLPAADLAVTWYGHSSALIEVDGYRVLADPVWSDRCSPSRAVGPQRLHPVPTPLDALPAIDAVIISHDHYDHLDVDTIKQLARTQRAKFFVPLGIGAHLRAWHIPADRIVELDWNQSAELGELTLVCTPARHFSGRFLNRNVTLWSSWALIGPTAPGVLRRGHRLHQELRRHRRRPRPVRPHADADRGVSPRLAGHPHESRGRGPRPPRRQRRRASGADPLGDVPARAASVVRAGGADCSPPRRRRASRLPPHGPASGSRRARRRR